MQTFREWLEKKDTHDIKIEESIIKRGGNTYTSDISVYEKQMKEFKKILDSDITKLINSMGIFTSDISDAKMIGFYIDLQPDGEGKLKFLVEYKNAKGEKMDSDFTYYYKTKKFNV